MKMDFIPLSYVKGYAIFQNNMVMVSFSHFINYF